MQQLLFVRLLCETAHAHAHTSDHCENCESINYCFSDDNCTLCQTGFVTAKCINPNAKKSCA